MGGYGSGRPAERATINRCWSYCLSTTKLREILQLGRAGFRLTFDVHVDRMDVEGDVDAAAGWLELRHLTRREPSRLQTYRIRLTSLPMRFGGVRWSFICPLSGRRVMKLYLPLGGTVFAARQAYRLKHDVTQMGTQDRRWRKMAKVAHQLGNDHPAPVDGPPPKPKGMRQHTYERLRNRYEWAAEGYWEIADAQLARLVRRLP